MNKIAMCPEPLYLQLRQYIESCIIRWDVNTLLGKASDGQEVQIGQFGEWEEIASYLAAHPNPTDW